MINFFHNLASFLEKNANFFRKFFGENIFKMITSVPEYVSRTKQGLEGDVVKIRRFNVNRMTEVGIGRGLHFHERELSKPFIELNASRDQWSVYYKFCTWVGSYTLDCAV
jgi:hypothetical protein